MPSSSTDRRVRKDPPYGVVSEKDPPYPVVSQQDTRSPVPDPIVSLADVRFSYGSRVVLDDLNLAVAPGESVALVGRSGAGKSTILKLINRLLLPDAGQVTVEGRDTREWDPIALRRRTGYVLQEIGLLPHLTVEEN